MSVIEQAAKRLAELRKAGITVGVSKSVFVGGSAAELRDIRSEDAFPAEVTVSAADRMQSASNRSVVRPSSTVVSKKVSIDLARLAELGLVTLGNPRSQVSEEFRVIKRPLIRNATGKGAAPIKNGNLVMVTSALPGEGKSSSAASLAMSIAMELDKTVLLVDADVAKPALMRMFGIEETRGLLDVLVDDSLDLSAVLLRTDVDKLVILPSGTAHPQATELLASDAMTKLLDEMAARYPDRIIIFDSPPLLLTNEARALAAHMGQIVVVVEAERTRHAALTQALALIDACPVKLLLLNKSSPGGAGDHYRYYGSGGYGHYGYGV